MEPICRNEPSVLHYDENKPEAEKQLRFWQNLEDVHDVPFK